MDTPWDYSALTVEIVAKAGEMLEAAAFCFQQFEADQAGNAPWPVEKYEAHQAHVKGTMAAAARVIAAWSCGATPLLADVARVFAPSDPFAE